jgi:hypothetical protein
LFLTIIGHLQNDEDQKETAARNDQLSSSRVIAGQEPMQRRPRLAFVVVGSATEDIKGRSGHDRVFVVVVVLG